MLDAYIIDGVRTARGAANGVGALRGVRPIELLGQLYRALQARNHLDTAMVGDILLGCGTSMGEQEANLAKTAARYAGWSEDVSGMTINRGDGSGLEAINMAALKVHAGITPLVVTGGIEAGVQRDSFADEDATHADPLISEMTRSIPLGVAADLLASLEGYTGAEMDAYSVQSHQRAIKARNQGHFNRSLVPIRKAYGRVLLEQDELMRDGLTTRHITHSAPLFARDVSANTDRMIRQRYPHLPALQHLHHAANIAAPADGAALLLLANKARAEELRLPMRARIRTFANASTEPLNLLVSGQKATEAALAQAGMAISDIDLFEYHEGFAASVLKYMRDLTIAPQSLNSNGGAIALGHPLGASGCMLAITLLDELERRHLRRGIVAISGAAGLGVATIIERV